MALEIAEFYDSLADVYHLIFEDWDRAIARQAEVLDSLLRTKLGTGSFVIHDCACGIGTQAIGLAGLGHTVSGSDLSEGAVRRARVEAETRGFEIPFRVSDMTTLTEYADAAFEVLGAFDNALPHLSKGELRDATKAFQRVLRGGGMFVGSIRDYDLLMTTRPTFQGPAFFGTAGQRRIVHQVWDWTSDDAYDVHQYLSLEHEGGWHALHFPSRYRCLLREEVTQALVHAGFVDVAWSMPPESGYYQPIVSARVP